MNNMPVLPLGHFVLVEVLPVVIKSKGGIILNTSNEQERERTGRDLAKVIAFGPIAYKGFADCQTPADWGVEVGDVVELRTRYDGKFTRSSEYDKAYENYRYVLDNDIIGKATGEFLETVKGGQQ